MTEIDGKPVEKYIKDSIVDTLMKQSKESSSTGDEVLRVFLEKCRSVEERFDEEIKEIREALMKGEEAVLEERSPNPLVEAVLEKCRVCVNELKEERLRDLQEKKAAFEVARGEHDNAHLRMDEAVKYNAAKVDYYSNARIANQKRIDLQRIEASFEAAKQDRDTAKKTCTDIEARKNELEKSGAFKRYTSLEESRANLKLAEEKYNNDKVAFDKSRKHVEDGEAVVKAAEKKLNASREVLQTVKDKKEELKASAKSSGAVNHEHYNARTGVGKDSKALENSRDELARVKKQHESVEKALKESDEALKESKNAFEYASVKHREQEAIKDLGKKSGSLKNAEAELQVVQGEYNDAKEAVEESKKALEELKAPLDTVEGEDTLETILNEKSRALEESQRALEASNKMLESPIDAETQSAVVDTLNKEAGVIRATLEQQRNAAAEALGFCKKDDDSVIEMFMGHKNATGYGHAKEQAAGGWYSVLQSYMSNPKYFYAFCIIACLVIVVPTMLYYSRHRSQQRAQYSGKYGILNRSKPSMSSI